MSVLYPLTVRLPSIFGFTSSLTVMELAAHLGISKNTVKTHLQNIFGKLAVSNALQAINKARMLGLV